MTALLIGFFALFSGLLLGVLVVYLYPVLRHRVDIETQIAALRQRIDALEGN